MEEHISSMRDAYQSYKDAWPDVLIEFSADIGQVSNDLAMEMAIESLHNHTEEFLVTCETMRANMEPPSTILAHINRNLFFVRNNNRNLLNHMTGILAQHDIPAAAYGHLKNNLNNQLEGFILACEYLKDFIATEVRGPEVEVEVEVDPNNEVDPNATEAAPVSPDNAQVTDHLELSSKDQGEMESDTQHVNEANMSDENEETEERHTEALPILPDPDTNNNS